MPLLRNDLQFLAKVRNSVTHREAALIDEISVSAVIDVSQWPLEADATLTCRVDIADLAFVRNRLGRNTIASDDMRADVNRDDRIDLLDLVYVRNRMGQTCGD